MTSQKSLTRTQNRARSHTLQPSAAAPRARGAANHTNGSSKEPAAVWLAPSELRPWRGNPRKNEGPPVERVVASIKRYGFGAPIVARAANCEIIAGHTRWLAAKELRLQRVPVRLLDISEADAHMLALLDNRYTELTGWSDDLGKFLSSLSVPDVEFAGWTAEELEKLLRVDDAAPNAPDSTGEPAVSFAVCSAELIAEAHVEELLGKTYSDYAPGTADVMCELNRCAAGGKARVTLCDRWFPHRYDIFAGHSKTTPNQTLCDAVTVRKCCDYLAKLPMHPTRRLLMQTLMMFGTRQAARQFPIHVARDIYTKYSRPDAAVLDPCAGWGGRLLGWMCAQQGGTYLGIDASARTCASFAAMIGDLNIERATIRHAAFEDVALEPNAYDFAFTSPPYFDLEDYGEDGEQSTVRYKQYAAWRDGFLQPLIANTLRALRPGSHLVLNVTDVAEYKIPVDAQRIAKALDAHVQAVRKVNFSSNNSSGFSRDGIEEDLIVIQKGANS